MTAFHAHDEAGRILFSNKVTDAGGYGDVLREREIAFAEQDSPRHADLSREFVWNGELASRPVMPIEISKTSVKAGQSDGVRLKRIPAGASLSLSVAGATFHSGVVDGSRVDYSPPVPGVYLIAVSLWPYRDWMCEVTAT